MPSPHVDVRDIPEELHIGLEVLQDRLELPEGFTTEVLTEATVAAELEAPEHIDRTDIEFVTIDPPTSMDLDQALQIEKDGDGYLVRYAISDVGHFVKPGGEIDTEAHRRGQTLYAPSARIPLHPPELSEAAASLLADDKPRPAMLWEHRLDADGELIETNLTRALVVNHAKLNYAGVQARPSTRPAPASRSIRRSSARPPPRCSPTTSRARRCSGSTASTPTAN